MPRTANNLSPQATPLIGRERDLARLQQHLLGEDVRLITLTGPGGTGKTRLAIACAQQMLQHFYDGVYFVDLAPLRHARFVLSTIARTLQVQMSSSSPSDALLRFLHGKCILLVLDNFEHVQAAAPELSALLSGCSDVKVLATSRAPLHLRWEHEVPIPPLPLPDLRAEPDVKELLRSAAVALFFERARAVRPDFVPTRDNVDAVARICVRLDGLPLALELAAARIKALGARDLLRLLEQHLAPLATGALDAAPRHRSLQATISWSHDLLRPAERTLFRRLAVFAGGWTLDAAQTVCGDEHLDAPAVVDTLARLVDQSLVQLEEVQGRSRYRMLETLRQFAHEQLESSGEVDDLARRHATHFLSVGELLGPEARVFGTEASTVRAELEVEHDNMRAALRWLIEHGEADLALRMADALQSFWYVRGPYTETRRALDEVLAMDGAQAPTALRASLLNGAAIAAAMNGDVSGGLELNEQALAIARTTNNLLIAGHALQSLANVAELRGDFEQARGYAQEALTTDRRIGNQFRESVVLSNLGRMSWKQGDLAAAQDLAEHPWPLHALTGRRGSSRMPSSSWAWQSVISVNSAPRGRRWRRHCALSRQDGDSRVMAYCLDALGRVALIQGRRADARQQLAESLRLWLELGEQAKVADSLENHAQLAAASGQPDVALRLAGAATGLRMTLRVAAPPHMQSLHKVWLERARTTLGPERADALLSNAQTMTAEEAVRYALRRQLTTSDYQHMRPPGHRSRNASKKLRDWSRAVEAIARSRQSWW